MARLRLGRHLWLEVWRAAHERGEKREPPVGEGGGLFKQVGRRSGETAAAALFWGWRGAQKAQPNIIFDEIDGIFSP
jgi:hypothetical protein